MFHTNINTGQHCDTPLGNVVELLSWRQPITVGIDLRPENMDLWPKWVCVGDLKAGDAILVFPRITDPRKHNYPKTIVESSPSGKLYCGVKVPRWDFSANKSVYVSSLLYLDNVAFATNDGKQRYLGIVKYDDRFFGPVPQM